MNKKTLKGLIIAGVVAGVGTAVAYAVKRAKQPIIGTNINEENDKENKAECGDFSKIRAERGWNEENDLEESECCGGECSNCCGGHECTCHNENEEEEPFSLRGCVIRYKEDDEEEEYDEEDEEEDDEDSYEEADNAKYQLQRCIRKMKNALNNSYDVEDLKGYLANIFSDITYAENDLNEEDAETYRKLKSIKEKADEFINTMEERDLSTLDDLRSSEENEELLNKIVILIDKVDNL